MLNTSEPTSHLRKALPEQVTSEGDTVIVQVREDLWGSIRPPPTKISHSLSFLFENENENRAIRRTERGGIFKSV